MYSDAVKIIETKTNGNGNGFHKSCEVYEKWQNWNASQISHHGTMCCDIAREWLTSTDFSELGGNSFLTGPRWLRQKFNWGASSFPIYWCEAVRKKTLDCGALAALAFEIFTARGVRTYRIQMVQRFSEVSTAQWSHSWRDDIDEPLRWTDNDLIYHEGCAIQLGGGEIKVWDASAGWWIDSKSKDGYGALLAIRLSSFNLSADLKFTWGDNCFAPDEWVKISSQKDAALELIAESRAGKLS